MSGKFQFIFNEKELSIIQDALDIIAEQRDNLPPDAWATTTFKASEFGEVAAQIAERLAY